MPTRDRGIKKMAASKKPPAKKQIIDVAHPDSAPAPASGKPVIVTNRPIMKDPMVNSDASSGIETDSTVQKILVKTSGELKLNPLSAPELPIEAALKETEEKSKATEEPKVEETKDEVPVADESKPAPVPEMPETAAVETKAETAATEEPPAEQAAVEEPATPEEKPEESSQAETPAATPPAEKAPETPLETPKPSEAPSPENKSQAAIPDAQKIEETEAAKKAQHEEEIEKLTESKEYYLPINTVEKRKSRRFVSLGVLLSLLLIIAWGDVALDSGLVGASYGIPHTHFFSSHSLPSEPASAVPASGAAATPKPSSATLAAAAAARSQAGQIQSLLENYYKNNKAYPSSLNPDQLISQPGANRAYASAFTVPAGTKFVYTAVPDSCTTTSLKCTHYILKAEAVSGQSLRTLHSLN